MDYESNGTIEGADVNCTQCQHIDRRNGECRELMPQVLCGQCRELFMIRDIRCPRCHIASTTVVAALDRDDEDFIVSKFCPLTRAERGQLRDKQAAALVPVVRQKELF